MAGKRLDPIHPGEILAEEFMGPFGLSANALAKQVEVPVTRISEILRGRRGITADTALRLARFFGTSPELWLGLQAEYSLRVAQRDVGGEIKRCIPPPEEVAPGRYRPVLRKTLAAPGQVREPSETYRVMRGAKAVRVPRRSRRSTA